MMVKYKKKREKGEGEGEGEGNEGREKEESFITQIPLHAVAASLVVPVLALLVGVDGY